MTIRTYLKIVTIMLVIAACAGVYVWYVYQHVMKEKEQAAFLMNEGASNEAPVEDTPTLTSTTTNVVVPVSQSKEEVSPTVISADALPSEQRAILESFGMGDASIEITDAMLTCAKGVLGEERLNALIQGSAPTPLEALRLAGCLKK